MPNWFQAVVVKRVFSNVGLLNQSAIYLRQWIEQSKSKWVFIYITTTYTKHTSVSPKLSWAVQAQRCWEHLISRTRGRVFQAFHCKLVQNDKKRNLKLVFIIVIWETSRYQANTSCLSWKRSTWLHHERADGMFICRSHFDPILCFSCKDITPGVLHDLYCVHVLIAFSLKTNISQRKQ